MTLRKFIDDNALQPFGGGSVQSYLGEGIKFNLPIAGGRLVMTEHCALIVNEGDKPANDWWDADGGVDLKNAKPDVTSQLFYRDAPEVAEYFQK
jgi:hypothetical protein